LNFIGKIKNGIIVFHSCSLPHMQQKPETIDNKKHRCSWKFTQTKNYAETSFSKLKNSQNTLDAC
jgi:hypothetical protein